MKREDKRPSWARDEMDPALRAAYAALRRRVKDEPGFALNFLQEIGVLNKRGKLTKRYGGEG